MINPFLSLNRRVLVVDDNPAIHEDFRHILCAEDKFADELAASNAVLFGEAPPTSEKVRFDVDFSSQGAEAIARVQRSRETGQPYSLAFVDVQMPPGLDGIETTARLWEADPELEVVICTAHSDYSWQDIIARLGQTDRLLVLKKPFDMVEVLQLAHALNAKWHLMQHSKRKIDNLESCVSQRTSELHTAEEYFRLIAENAGDLIAIIGAGGEQQYISPSVTKVLGVPMEVLRVSGIMHRLHLDDCAAFLNSQLACAVSKASRVLECRLQCQNGDWRDFECHMNPVLALGGQFERMVVVLRDITERKKSQAELEFKNAIMCTQMEVAFDGILVVDSDGNAVTYNSRFAEIWSIPTTFPKLQHDDMLLHVAINKIAEPSAFLERIKRIYAERNEISRDEIVLNDGRVLDRYSAPMSGPTGHYFGRVWYFHEVTERRQTEVELRNSREQLRALAERLETTREEESIRISRAIHDELGHALTSLSIDLASMERSLAKPPVPCEKLRLRAESMSKLLEQTTKAVQRIIMDLRPSLLDDLGLTAALEWLVEEVSARTGIRFRWECKLQDLELPSKQSIVVFRIFQEALTNIVRHSQATKVDLSCVKRRDSLVFRVRDNGIGFNEKDLQVRDAVGLIGLRERALLINGKLELRSAKGEGTTVILTVPECNMATEVMSRKESRE